MDPTIVKRGPKFVPLIHYSWMISPRKKYMHSIIVQTVIQCCFETQLPQLLVLWMHQTMIFILGAGHANDFCPVGLLSIPALTSQWQKFNVSTALDTPRKLNVHTCWSRSQGQWWTLPVIRLLLWLSAYGAVGLGGQNYTGNRAHRPPQQDIQACKCGLLNRGFPIKRHI